MPCPRHTTYAHCIHYVPIAHKMTICIHKTAKPMNVQHKAAILIYIIFSLVQRSYAILCISCAIALNLCALIYDSETNNNLDLGPMSILLYVVFLSYRTSAQRQRNDTDIIIKAGSTIELLVVTVRNRPTIEYFS